MQVVSRSSVLDTLSRNWWSFIVRGIAGVLFGLGAILWPALTLQVLIVLFAIYAIVDGLVSITAAFGAVDRFRWSMVVWGVVCVAAGVAALVWPNLTALALVYLIAAWAIVTGVIEIVAAYALRKEINEERLLAVAGGLSIVAGIAMLIAPGAGAVAITWLIGGYAIGFGALLILLGTRLRGWQPGVGMPTPTG
jgi:uncharacterized membrane protein HdeD (DUF308 family)